MFGRESDRGLRKGVRGACGGPGVVAEEGRRLRRRKEGEGYEGQGALNEGWDFCGIDRSLRTWGGCPAKWCPRSFTSNSQLLGLLKNNLTWLQHASSIVRNRILHWGPSPYNFFISSTPKPFSLAFSVLYLSLFLISILLFWLLINHFFSFILFSFFLTSLVNPKRSTPQRFDSLKFILG